MVRIAIIGGGIKGATTAALLSLVPGVTVSMFEAGVGPSGATRTNHGRLHAGTAGWPGDSQTLMSRRARGSRLWRALGIGQGQVPASYLFSDEVSRDAFILDCRAADIPVRPSVGVAGPWNQLGRKTAEVHEYSFDPAALAQTLTQAAEVNGASVRYEHVVQSVARTGSTAFQVECASGYRETVDLIVDCSARWSASIRLSWRETPYFDVAWRQWQIMATRAEGLSPLDRVVVDMQSGGEHRSVVPHGSYITLDYKSAAKDATLSAPPAAAPEVERVDDNDDYLQTVTSSFPELSRSTAVFRFWGIQGRQRGAPPGSISQIRNDPAAAGYLSTLGGQASTALLDSLDICDDVWRRGYLEFDIEHTLARLGTVVGASVERSAAIRDLAPAAWKYDSI